MNTSIKQPEGPDDFIQLTKRTVTFVVVCVVSALFTMGLGTLLSYHAYSDARDDLHNARAESACSRQLSAETQAAVGRVVSELGVQSTQIGKVFTALPTLSGNPSIFTSLVNDFAPIADRLTILQHELDAQLEKQLAVNDLCTKGGGNTP